MACVVVSNHLYCNTNCPKRRAQCCPSAWLRTLAPLGPVKVQPTSLRHTSAANQTLQFMMFSAMDARPHSMRSCARRGATVRHNIMPQLPDRAPRPPRPCPTRCSAPILHAVRCRYIAHPEVEYAVHFRMHPLAPSCNSCCVQGFKAKAPAPGTTVPLHLPPLSHFVVATPLPGEPLSSVARTFQSSPVPHTCVHGQCTLPYMSYPACAPARKVPAPIPRRALP